MPLYQTVVFWEGDLGLCCIDYDRMIKLPNVDKVGFKKAYLSDEAAKEVVQRIALKRLQEPEDIANAAAFLSTPAARNITGQNIIVDGGITVRDPFYGDSKDETLV